MIDNLGGKKKIRNNKSYYKSYEEDCFIDEYPAYKLHYLWTRVSVYNEFPYN
jgi:hypothetical protein